MYSVDYARLIKILMPPVKRLLTWLSDYLNAMLSVWSKVNTDFTDQIDKHNYTLRFTGQVVSIEHLLNDLFDNTLRRIYIEDGERFSLNYVFLNTEQRERFFYLYQKSESIPPTGYFRLKSEHSGSSDFVVFIPSAILSSVDNDIIKSYIDIYRQAGKRYHLQSF